MKSDRILIDVTDTSKRFGRDKKNRKTKIKELETLFIVRYHGPLTNDNNVKAELHQTRRGITPGDIIM